jgi:hypothetical protein
MLRNELRKATGIGSGIGTNRSSLFKTWIWGGAFCWGVPVFIYVFVVIVIIAMFLPLTKTIVTLS